MRAAERANGFTLIEVVLSVAASTILVGALLSAMVLVSRAVPATRPEQEEMVRAAELVEQMCAELQTADAIIDRQSASIEFTVPDRDADGTSERIRYAWSGVAGEPLLRRFNGVADAVALERVKSLALSFSTSTAQSTSKGNAVASAESLLFGHNSSSNLADASITSTDWVAESFTPVLPGDATSWSVKKVRLRLRRVPPHEGSFRVQLRTLNNGDFPSDTVLEEVIVAESALGASYAWYTVSFATVTGLAPGTGLSLVIAHQSGVAACDVEYCSQNTYTAFGKFATTPVYATTWIVSHDAALNCEVWGQVWTAPASAVDVYYLNEVRVALTPVGTNASSISSGVRLLNLPTVSGP
ncbi:MAG: hypothetical protein CHACPFDD_00022 [Phycisphaerae bacterium]|nr:hypothetical protein [Phycisphaerae bacterium]